MNATGNGCAVCPNGKYSNPSITSCSKCDETPGYVSLANGTGAAACEYCSLGFYADQASHTCKECEIDTCSIGGVNECFICPSGGTENTKTATTCIPCPPGTITNGTKCHECEKGKSGEFGTSSCTLCAAGHYSQPGSSYCEQCLTGKYYDDPSNECKLCLSGKFTATGGVGIGECNACEKGSYSSILGASTCYTCAPGKHANADQTECLLYPAGKFSGVAASKCDDVCEKGKMAPPPRAVASVPLATTVELNEKFCGKVPEGVEMTVDAFTVKNLEVKPGFWWTNASNSMILPCVAEEQCVGCSDPEKQCKEGHGGPLCAVCLEDFASTGSDMFLKCSICEGGDASTTIVVGFGAFFLVIFLMIGLACCYSRSSKKTTEDDEDDHADPSNNDSLDRFSDANKKVSKIDGLYSLYAKARPYGKILLSYLQIIGGLSSNLDIAFPPMFTTLMSVVSSVVNVEFLNMMPLGFVMNSNFHHTLVVYTLAPLFIGGAMMISYVTLKRRGKVEASNSVFGWISFLILSSFGMKLFSTFRCRKFDRGYGSYLMVDYSVDYASEEHKFYEKYAMGFILVYVVGIPSMYAHLLWKNKKLLDSGQKQLEQEHGEAEALKRALEKRKSNEEKHPQLKSLLFLYELKQMLTGGLVVLGSRTLSKIIISILICLLSMRVFAGCKPYIKDRIDVFSEMSQWQIFLVMFATLLIRIAQMSEEFEIHNKTAFAIILSGAQAVAPAVIIVTFLIKGQEMGTAVVREVAKSISKVKDFEEEEEKPKKKKKNGGAIVGALEIVVHQEG
ncbi:hypothetical protein TL16_g05679 [Triparma laevis f. inornata]|uniref:Tyrosine-protein kinase ephrin type A/B receptor-like domain-containing protein n=1 Tax=Triparma laevis f. inornata TaxID=1714386 RepID=A0A9W7AFX4_9STRA|nr:hypothetical protein TL16_g05679 [Triparma laevis f. inornata]